MAPGLCLSSWSWGEAFPRVLMGTGMGKTTGLSHVPHPMMPELGGGLALGAASWHGKGRRAGREALCWTPHAHTVLGVSWPC